VSEIEHWLESGAPADVAEWLEAARAEQPSRRVVDRSAVLAATAVVTNAAVASGAALEAASSGTAAKASMLALAQWGLAGVIAGSAVAGGSALMTRHAAQVSRRTPSFVAPKPALLPLSAAARSSAGVAETPTNNPPLLPSSAPAAPSGSVHPRAASTSSTAASTSSTAASTSSAAPDARMSAELALLEQAQAHADRGETSVALELLSQHDRQFGPSAPLSPEARYLELEVLRASGRSADAASVARDILTRDAAGLHADRARQLLREEKVIRDGQRGD
jgi:hypothetical protein